MTTTISPSTDLLQRSLAANAAFSLASGAALVLGAPWLVDLLGPPAWLLVVAGVGVAAFGAGIARYRRIHPVTVGRIAFWGDVAWVAGTVALAPVVSSSFTTVGGWAAVAVALVVADLAIAEGIGLRRTRR